MMNVKQILKLAEQFDFGSDVDQYVKSIQSLHCIINCGQQVEYFLDHISPKMPLNNIYVQAYHNFYHASESDEMAEGAEDEFWSWNKQAKKDAALVKKMGLPLTMANACDAYMKKGPFASSSSKK